MRVDNVTEAGGIWGLGYIRERGRHQRGGGRWNGKRGKEAGRFPEAGQYRGWGQFGGHIIISHPGRGGSGVITT